MNSRKMPSHTISGIFIFFLLGLFAVFSTILVLLGAKAYRAAVERTGLHNTDRISTAYLRTMLRAEDEAGVFSIEKAEGTVTEDGEERPVSVETLSLRHDYGGGDEFVTRIYVYGGRLREWFTEASTPFRPAEGEAVCAADEMTAELKGGLLEMRIRTGETWETVCLALRTESEEQT